MEFTFSLIQGGGGAGGGGALTLYQMSMIFFSNAFFTKINKQEN